MNTIPKPLKGKKIPCFCNDDKKPNYSYLEGDVCSAVDWLFQEITLYIDHCNVHGIKVNMTKAYLIIDEAFADVMNKKGDG